MFFKVNLAKHTGVLWTPFWHGYHTQIPVTFGNSCPLQHPTNWRKKSPFISVIYTCAFMNVHLNQWMHWMLWLDNHLGIFSLQMGRKNFSINDREDKNEHFGISRLLLRYIQFPVCYSRTRHKAQIEAGHCKDIAGYARTSHLETNHWLLGIRKDANMASLMMGVGVVIQGKTG